MLTIFIYFLICFSVACLSWALHWGPSAQAIALLMGLAIFLLQKFIHKVPLSHLGFRKCTWRQMLKGLTFPLAILGLITLVNLLLSAIQVLPLSETKNPFGGGTPMASLWEFLGFLAVYSAILFLLEFVTEELMFRGYLLGNLRSLEGLKGLWLASSVFGLWHLPIAIWEIGLDPLRTPLYVINMFLLGALLGLLFLESNSLIPVALFHALWNTIEYSLFGFANQLGLFVGSSRVNFDPEEGWIGTVVMILFTGVLLTRRRKGQNVDRNQQAVLERTHS